MRDGVQGARIRISDTLLGESSIRYNNMYEYNTAYHPHLQLSTQYFTS